MRIGVMLFSFCFVLSILFSSLGVFLSSDVLNTLFTVIGIIFPLSLNMAQSFNTTKAENKKYNDKYRTFLKKVQMSFIVFFIIGLTVYVLPIENWQFRLWFLSFDFKNFKGSVLIYIFLSYSYNYYQLIEEKYKMEKEIEI